MAVQCADIARRLRAARYEGGSAVLLGSGFLHPTGVMRWGHLAIAQLLREQVVHRLWTRSADPHWPRICAYYEILPELPDAVADGAAEPGQTAILSLQGCHAGRFAELLLNEAVNLWIVAGLTAADEPLQDVLGQLPPDRVLVVPAADVDGYLDALAREFGEITLVPAGDVAPGERLRQAALLQMLRKMSREEQIAEFERMMQAAAVTHAASAQRVMQVALEAEPRFSGPYLEEANRLQEMAYRLLPSPAAMEHWGRSLSQVAGRLTGLAAARVYRQATGKLRLAARTDLQNGRAFQAWLAAMERLAQTTPGEAARGVQSEVDREFQWRVAHGVALTGDDLLRWARVLVAWAALAPPDEAKRLFSLARTRVEEAKRRSALLEPVEFVWATLLHARSGHVEAAEARRLIEEALGQLAGARDAEAHQLRARCYFRLAALPDAATAELVAMGDEAMEHALEAGGPRQETRSMWASLYVDLAAARARQNHADAAGFLAYGQDLYAEAGDYRGWSASYLLQSRFPQLASQSLSKKQILESARETALEAECEHDGAASFELARLAGALRDEPACRGWLDKARRHQTLPPLRLLLEEPEFRAFRQKDWFRELTGV